MDNLNLSPKPVNTKDNQKDDTNFQKLISYIYEKTMYCFCVFIENPLIIITTIYLILLIIQFVNRSIFTKATFSLLLIFIFIEVGMVEHRCYCNSFYEQRQNEEGYRPSVKEAEK